MSEKYDGLQEIIDEALESMAAETAGEFDPQRCNLAEFCRRTGLSRQRARTIKANGFKVRPHGRLGTKAARTVLTGHTGLVDDQLRKGVTNSQVIYVFGQVPLSEMITESFRVWARNFFGFGHGRAASFLTCPA